MRILAGVFALALAASAVGAPIQKKPVERVVVSEQHRNKPMTTPQLKEDLARDEGLKLKAYKDTRGIYTIAVGHNVSADPNLRPRLSQLITKGITQEEAMALLDSDVARARAQLDQAIPWWKNLNDPRQDIILGMVFNLGLQKFLTWHHTLDAIQSAQTPEDFKRVGDMLANTQPWASQIHDRARRYGEQLATGVRVYE